MRLAASYESSYLHIPTSLNGVLYKNRIKAIMSYKVPELKMGGVREDESDEAVWDMYMSEIRGGGDRVKRLLQ